ncbi:MAG: 50S ribosomal protein L15 [Candidatus Portnoybacteria bacterium]|nr:50S ribosomal protein L15 [Candidatus Portnoybacteria bacterium]MDD4982567.1 50S ribosomal protein L15 [Candidatus Portnoybacteria bacterium]
MQLHQISKNKSKVSKRVGRGGKRGTFSGRGVKGQKSRSGRKLRPEWRDALKSIPKKRGYKFKSIKTKPAILNLQDLNRVFNGGEAITPEVLLQKGLISKSQSRLPEIKILGQGKMTKKLNFKGLYFSAGAKDAIIKAGGSIS